MDVARLKNIAIIILAALNICFLVIIGLNRFEESRETGGERAALAELFADNGISIEPETIPTVLEAAWYTVNRDTDEEAKIVSKLLGRAEAEDQGGNMYYYENENGNALFRNNGEFEIRLNYVNDGAGAGKTAARLLEDMGISFISDGAEMEERGDSRSIVYLCAWNDSPVLNCEVRLTIYAGGSVILAGRRINGTPQRSSGGEMLGINTLLVRFLDEIMTEGHVCNRIESIELCYNMNYSASGTVLEPVWRIVTDGSEYQVSVRDGKITA